MKGSVEIWDANGVLESVVHPTEDTGQVDRPSLAEIPFEVFTVLPKPEVLQEGRAQENAHPRKTTPEIPHQETDPQGRRSR